jgi:hypothetical protein
MNYRLKQDIPNTPFKKGMVFANFKDSIYLAVDGYELNISQFAHPKTDGLIEKVEEPKWTDSDMIELIEFNNDADSWNAKKVFAQFVKSKQEEGI